MGWYLNGCACGEHVELNKNYAGDVLSLHEFGFDVSMLTFFSISHVSTPPQAGLFIVLAG